MALKMVVAAQIPSARVRMAIAVNPGVRANPPHASGPDGSIIINHSEVWAGDAPSICTTVAPFSCTPDSSIKAIDIATGNMIAVMNTGGQRRADELCEDVGRGEIVFHLAGSGKY